LKDIKVRKSHACLTQLLLHRIGINSNPKSHQLLGQGRDILNNKIAHVFLMILIIEAFVISTHFL
jgi:hypothetical protein